ncbi:hypothetical protein L1F30_05600 [Simiduia sp. 21SJ11W-1]|uniref:hypothetical protein n=1 Tax=Simiduia sp. 21SJ11W-1 TaxID=2909669 RepID=UPI00209CEE24|nr:hypothetical protein [Simiduia sp. 21SJ11W-1]UTA49021.1 hypothetical protein L1F30_05600 [Simiduia sp. 21SJ11W-1]
MPPCTHSYKPRYRTFFVQPLFFVILLLSAATAQLASAEQILSCKDAKGRPIFTDDPRRCGEAKIETREVRILNSHSQFGRQQSREYHNYANRAHLPLTGYAINIIVERELAETDPELARNSARKLETAVLAALARFPNAQKAKFSGIRYYIFSGSDSSYGGKDSGLWYFAKGNRISPRFDDSIIINSARNFMRMSDELALAISIHELAHGFYHYHKKRLYPLALKVYENAKKSGLYTNRKTAWNKVIEKAYALENHREYFAELSAMYFSRHYYEPFERNGLLAYDPQGYKLIDQAWLGIP